MLNGDLFRERVRHDHDRGHGHARDPVLVPLPLYGIEKIEEWRIGRWKTGR